MAEHALCRIVPEVDVVLPKIELRLHHLLRIGHHGPGQLEKGVSDIEWIGMIGTAVL